MYNNNLKAKEMMLDFIDTVFLLLLISFCVFYFIVGDNFAAAQKIVKAAFAFSWVGVIFVLKFKFSKVHFRKLSVESRLGEIVSYFDRIDRIKDLLLILTIPFVLMGIALWDKSLNAIDLEQSFFVFLLIYISHFILFRKKDDVSRLAYATNLDKLKDEVFVFFLPFFIILIAFANGVVDNLDVVQAFLVFALTYFRHKKILFSGESDFK